jgi:hypothetical protein
MTAELWVDDNGTGRKIQQLWVNDNGTARQIQEIWMNDNGTARMVYQALAITISNRTVTYLGGTPAEYHLNSDGNIYIRTSSVLTNIGSWVSNAAFVSLFECRATLTDGTLQSGTTGAWQSLSTTRTWTKGTAAGTINQCTILLEIRNATTGVVADSASITLRADRTI